MIVHEMLLDYRYQVPFLVQYDSVTKKVDVFVSTDREWTVDGEKQQPYKNKLYYYYDYDKVENQKKDIIWVTDDDKIVEINDCDMDNIKENVEFFDKLRELKTRDRIVNYLNFLKL